MGPYLLRYKDLQWPSSAMDQAASFKMASTSNFCDIMVYVVGKEDKLPVETY